MRIQRRLMTALSVAEALRKDDKNDGSGDAA
jgi:hypothetical protein